jgi:hypothetical protein
MAGKTPMTQNFLAETGETSTNPVILSATTAPTPGRTPIRVLVISSPEGVTHTIRNLHSMGFAHISHWSPLLPAPNHPGEVMSILTQYLLENR